jgi:hypothetical protein
MFATKAFYQGRPHSITIIFNTDDPKQAALMHACKVSFGDRYVREETLDKTCHLTLDVLPGGLREVQS